MSVGVALSTAIVPHVSAVGVRCTHLAVTPDFATSRTAFCAALVPNANGIPVAVIARTANAGRSWQQVTTTGLVTQPDDARIELHVSTEYQADHALYVTLNGSGTFRSTDGGASFVLVDPARGHLVAARYAIAAGPVTVLTRGVLVGALQGVAEGANNSFALDPPLPRRPIGGTPLLDLAFAAAPDAPDMLVAFGATGAGLTYHVQMFGCTPAFSCTSPRGTFPNRMDLDRVWLSPHFATDGVVIARLRDLTTFRRRLYRSTDGGATFRPLASLQSVLDAVYAAGDTPESAVSGTIVNGRVRLYARVAHYSRRGEPPTEQVLRSDDVGATWRRVAIGSADRGVHGSVPVSPPPGVDDEPDGFIVATGDRLFATGTSGVFCSIDGGVRWTATCPR